MVDNLTYEVIALYEDHTLEEIIKELSSWDEKMSKNLMEKLQNAIMVYYLQKTVMKNTFVDSKIDQQL